MEATQRFRDAVHEDPLPLDRAVLLIAAHDHSLDVDAQLLQLDSIAAGVGERSVDGVMSHVFGDLGFVGDSTRYDDAANSFLDLVLDRRTGLPIMLSVLAIEVGRRLGVGIDGVGLPGHFIVRDRSRPERLFDPFGGGASVDAAWCEERHTAAGHQIPWSESFLDGVEGLTIVARVLNNLMASHRRRQRRRDAALMASLTTMLPGAGPRELLAYVGALAESGSYARAAQTAELVAGKLDPETGAKVSAAALRYRARLN